MHLTRHDRAVGTSKRDHQISGADTFDSLSDAIPTKRDFHDYIQDITLLRSAGDTLFQTGSGREAEEINKKVKTRR